MLPQNAKKLYHTRIYFERDLNSKRTQNTHWNTQKTMQIQNQNAARWMECCNQINVIRTI